MTQGGSRKVESGFWLAAWQCQQIDDGVQKYLRSRVIRRYSRIPSYLIAQQLRTNGTVDSNKENKTPNTK